LRIAIVTQSYYPKPGGVTEVAYYTAKGLREKGHIVKIITTRYGTNNDSEPDVIRIGRNMLVPVNGAWVNVTLGLGLTNKLRRIFEHYEFDIVQTHCALVPTLPLLSIKAVLPWQKLIGTFHAAAEKNAAYKLFQGPLNRRASRFDRRIAVSRAAMKFAAKYFPGDYTIVPNGIDCNRFKPENEVLERYLDGAYNILYVGRMDRRKGVSYLLKALPIVQRNMKRKVRLIMVGEGKLRRIFCQRPLRMHGAEVVFVGRIPPEDLPRYYSTADLFCSPAIGQESFGIVLLEAMASGTPVVASDIPGYRNVITNRVDGILVPPRNPELLARAILEVATDNTLSAQLSEAGRAKALTYDWKIVVDMLEKVFMETLGIGEQLGKTEQVVQY